MRFDFCSSERVLLVAYNLTDVHINQTSAKTNLEDNIP
ncbi:hypothetical protein PFLA_b1218 [Pseudoalteromonas flavipulchra NCIMB 2033 = ATCC BAA-314]|nr:hypothetical protein [Pseudoalteromonas flavipulchra NCIMB 2033 = ATCC BAA-314]